MATKAVVCDHCKGKKNCTTSGGRSCRECMDAAGHGRHQFAAVRCSYCGGRGKRWVAVEEAAEAAPEAAAESEAPEPAEAA
jgi:hypothetical protein